MPRLAARAIAALILIFAGARTMAAPDQADASIPLRLTTANIHDAALRVLADGVYEVRTTGPDPYLFTEAVDRAVDAALQHVLAFEYFSTTGCGPVQAFVFPPLDEAHSVTGESLPIGQGWTEYAIDLGTALKTLPGKVGGLRLDFGTEAGKVVQVRALRLRTQTPQEAQREAQREASREAEKQHDARLRGYLERSYPCQVTHVAIDRTHVAIDGRIEGSAAEMVLAEVPIWTDATDPKGGLWTTPVKANGSGRFHTVLERHVPDAGRTRDRLLSRWAVVRQQGAGWELLSHARYADVVTPEHDLPDEHPRTKKGLGGFDANRPLTDLDDLGISAVTVNILLNGLMADGPGAGHTAFEYDGRTWYANDSYAAHLDRTMLAAAQHHLVVLAIILVGQGASAPTGSWTHTVAHPDATPAGIYVMPNLDSQEGAEAYGAALDYLARRYSQPDGKYGRIHHWIMHNEISAAWVWANAGDKPRTLYMDLYQRSMRMAQLLARQYYGSAKAFISLEHHWTMLPDPHFYRGRDLLDDLLAFGKAEGDFEWAIAYHPYPQNLFDPRVWADTQVNYTFDTPKITFKNLEVLDAWVRQPRTFFQGKRPRIVHLSEQGLNSPDYTEKSLQEQAAGMAYAWAKVKRLSTIEAFEYHNWIDSRGEGGLRIGLRRFPDDPDEPLGKKPIWYVYQALGTDKEEAATAFALPIVGLKSWDEALYRGPIR